MSDADKIVEVQREGVEGVEETTSSSAPPPPSPPLQQENKFIYTFNKFFADYILLLKKSSPAVKEALKKHYRSIENMSSTTVHLDWFKESMDVAGLCDAYTKDSSMKEKGDACVAKGVPASMLVGMDKAAFLQVLSYLCFLEALHYLYREYQTVSEQEAGREENVEALEGLLQKTLLIVPRVQNGEDTTDALEAILDDDLAGIMRRMITFEQEMHDMMHREAERESGQGTEKGEREGEGEGEGGEPFADMFARFKDSKLGKLASEITDEIDVDKLNMDNPMEMLNFSNLTNENSALGSIVSKMSSKVKNKMDSGEMRYEDFVGEAMGLFKGLDLGAIQKNPMFASMMNNMGGGGSASQPSSSSSSSSSSARGRAGGGGGGPSSAKDRLRQKLSERQQRNARP